MWTLMRWLYELAPLELFRHWRTARYERTRHAYPGLGQSRSVIDHLSIDSKAQPSPGEIALVGQFAAFYSP